MNIIILLSIALVLCAYFWPDCPKILKENKQMLLGVIVGLVLCSFYNLKVEGLDPDQSDTSSSTETQIIKRDQPVSGCGEKNTVDNGDGTFQEVWSNCDPDINICINNECVSNSEFTRFCNIAKRGANSSHNSSHALFKANHLTPETMGITDNSQHEHYHAYYDECTNPSDCTGESAFTDNTGRWCVNGGCMTTSDFSRLTCRN